jgi:heterodisulfide reductase subunit B2
MKYAYYPGCSASGTSKECEESLQATMRHLGAEMTELEDWNCCGAAVANGVSYLLSVALPARNLALAERAESDLVTGCSRCYMNLIRAIHYTQNNANVREKVNILLAEAGLQYSGKARLRHILDIVVNDVGLDAVAEKVKRPLEGLRVAPYYGCCQGMWTYAQFDTVEDPNCFDELLRTLGAEVVDYSLKTACCGGTLAMSKREVGIKLIGDLLAAAGDADCIVTACPLCTFNLNSFQKEAGRDRNSHFDIPVLFLTQIMGIAFDLPEKALGLQRNTVPVDRLYRKTAVGAAVSSGAAGGGRTEVGE